MLDFEVHGEIHPREVGMEDGFGVEDGRGAVEVR